MKAASAWSLERDASWQLVQVLGTNTPAIELYKGLGFAHRYDYWYLQSANAGAAQQEEGQLTPG